MFRAEEALTIGLHDGGDVLVTLNLNVFSE
jgi:hypothetical protein